MEGAFWGDYLSSVYPMHLRGTGESFAANIGGRHRDVLCVGDGHARHHS